MQRSWTTVNPPASAIACASAFRIPSCIHSTLAPIAIADSAMGGTSSGRRNTSTTSTGTGIDSRSG
jgi:hypothetical protein